MEGIFEKQTRKSGKNTVGIITKFSLFIFFIILAANCKPAGASKSDGTETLLLAGRYIGIAEARVTLTGKAQLTGSIKNARVDARTIPLAGPDAGKCDGIAGAALATGSTGAGSEGTNSGGNYSLTMAKPDNGVVCLVVSPTSESTSYSPFKRNVVFWRPSETNPAAVRLASLVILDASNTSSAQPANVNPITNVGVGKMAAVLKEQQLNANRLQLSALGSMGITGPQEQNMASIMNSANDSVGKMFFGISQTVNPSVVDFLNKTADNYDPTLAKQYTSILGGMDSVVSNILTAKGITNNNDPKISSVYDTYYDLTVGDVAGDGKLDGKNIIDESGATVTPPTEFAASVTNPVGTISQGMQSYVTQMAALGVDDGSGIVYTAADASNPTYTGAALTSTEPAPTNLSYNGSPFIFYQGIAISSVNPSITGVASSYSVSPALPSGLTLGSGTGIISGTATASSAATNYTVTATNASGSTTVVISITVNVPPAAPTSVSYGGTSFTYTAGSAVNQTATLTGGTSTFTVSPALPAGLSLNASTGAITGTPTTVQGLTNYTITATNISGTASATISITINGITVSYAGSPFTFIQNVAILQQNPTVSGTVTSYTVSPALPATLTLNASTGAITGTASNTQSLTNYTITATNAVTSTTANISITVNPNSAPTASSVGISGTTTVGYTLTGTYTFSDPDGHTQGASTYQWYRCTTTGDAGVAISGATGTTYVLQVADIGYYIKYEVTPRDQYNLAGTATKSAASSIVANLSNFSGVLNNIPLTALTSSGWTVCYQESYNAGSTPVANIVSACSLARVVMACRLTGSATLSVIASAPRTAVFTNTGDSGNTVTTSNGVDWYHSTSYSMGFSVQGDGIARSSCDTASGAFPNSRICWHTSGGNVSSGYRCGTDTGAASTSERLMLHSN